MRQTWKEAVERLCGNPEMTLWITRALTSQRAERRGAHCLCYSQGLPDSRLNSGRQLLLQYYFLFRISFQTLKKYFLKNLPFKMNVRFLVCSQFFFRYMGYNATFNDFISIASCYFENYGDSWLRMSPSSAHSSSGIAQP